jgi:ribosomal protein L4
MLPLPDLNAYEVLRAGRLVLTREALEALPERFGPRAPARTGA